MLEDKEVSDWLEEVCKEEPFKSATDLSIVMPLFGSDKEIVILGDSEKWKYKEVHFFGSSWVKEGEIFCNKPKAKSIEDELIFEASKEVEKHIKRGGACLDLS